MIYLYLFGTCFHFIYVFMIIGKYGLIQVDLRVNLCIFPLSIKACLLKGFVK